jgi:hypothetical protein
MESFYGDIENLPSPLVGALANFQDGQTYLALTLSFPQNNKFMNLSSYAQRKCYVKIINLVKHKMPFISVTTYEFTKMGKVHSHSVLCFDTKKSKIYSIVGLVSELSKHLVQSMGRRFTDGKLFNTDSGVTYKSPSVCLDYIADKEAYWKWITYMYKDPSYSDVWDKHIHPLLVKDLSIRVVKNADCS